MTDRESLLGAVAKRQAYSLEDAVTDALSFHPFPPGVRQKRVVGVPQGRCRTTVVCHERRNLQAAIEHGAIPDLACLDEHDNVVAFIESKFWATLTDHQPVTYWHALSAAKPSVLLFLAPHRRIESGSLWDQLVDRLRKADVELVDEKQDGWPGNRSSQGWPPPDADQLGRAAWPHCGDCSARRRFPGLLRNRPTPGSRRRRREGERLRHPTRTLEGRSRMRSIVSSGQVGPTTMD